MATDAAPTGPSSIAKNLASCNARTRNNAIGLLKLHLSSHPSISEDDMRKIWKGLFYCVWHADKQQYQIDLIDRLSSLLLSLQIPLSLLYFSVFLSTVRREWSGIDYLRLDKFYLLLRRFLRHLFLLLKSNSWNPHLSAQFIDLLSLKTLLTIDQFPAQGVNYHISEVFLEELREFLPLPKETLDLLLKPFLAVLEKSSDKILLSKIRSGLFDPLLQNGKKLLDRKTAAVDSEKEAGGGGGGDETEKLGTVALTMGLSGVFFRLASSPNTVQGNRKAIFGLHELFRKLEKDFERSGVEVSLPDAGAADVNSKQVEPDLGSADGSSEGDETKKKKKKSKKAKKMSNGVDKKSSSKKNKKKKNEVSSSVLTETISSSLEGENGGSDNAITFNEVVISNLQKQFEKVAAEAGMDVGSVSLCGIDTMQVCNTVSKKRKRAKSVDGQLSLNMGPNGEGFVGGSAAGKSADKSAKKVKFSMKSNLVWKPHSPLPPQSLRLPPSTTPRGSALKKGIPPGPIREAALVKKVKKRANAVKKSRKATKSVSPAVKRLRKLRTLAV